MSQPHDPPQQPLDTALFGERLLRIIDEGRRVATYKLALLLALLDACAGESDASGAAPQIIHTRMIASYVLRLYFPQYADFVTDDHPVTLRQITNPSSRTFRMIADLQRAAARSGCRNLDDVKRRFPDDYDRTLSEVERTFARYPIRLLQVVNGQHLPFLYDIDWDQSVTLRQLHREGGGLIRFRPVASDALVRLGPLMRPLIETHWTRMVASINRIDLEEERLRAHLFGAQRQAFPQALRRDLAELHDGRCFYCDQPLGNRFDLDHLIPWSRFPNDAIENLVPADSQCNNDKRATLPATTHLARWTKQLVISSSELIDIAKARNWLYDRPHTLAVARSTYRHLARGTPLWLGRDRVELFNGESVSGWL